MTIQSVEPDVSFSDDEAIHLYQIIRELLFNVLKHGQTNAAEVLIQRPEHDVVEATVKDKGLDFDPAILAQRSPMDRFGLFSVRERVESLAGTLTMVSAAGQGATVTRRLHLRIAIHHLRIWRQEADGA